MKLSIFLPRIFTDKKQSYEVKYKRKMCIAVHSPCLLDRTQLILQYSCFITQTKVFIPLKVLSSLRGLFNPHFTLYLHSPDVKGKFQLVRMKLLAFAKYSKHFIQNFILLNSRWMTLAVKCDEVVQNSGLQRKLLRKFKLTQNIHAFMLSIRYNVH